MPNTRNQVFNRVQTDFSVRGITRVEWSLRPRFCEPPHTFQLQVSRNGGVDWTDVGVPVVDIYQAFDDERRLCAGKDQRVVYRVKLTTGEGNTYFSDHSTVLGNLTQRQWLQAREMIRRAKIQMKQSGLRSLDGYLLKRRVQGTPCTECVDPHTGGILNSSCENCGGTGFIDGYWQAGAHNMIDLSPELRHTHRDNNLQRGTVDDQVAVGRFVGLPLIHSRDVWVDRKGDQRYQISKVSHKAEMDQVPIVVDVELRLLSHDNIIYTVDVTEPSNA